MIRKRVRTTPTRRAGAILLVGAVLLACFIITNLTIYYGNIHKSRENIMITMNPLSCICQNLLVLFHLFTVPPTYFSVASSGKHWRPS